MKAVIAGGGIGGLNAALCFHHHGWDVALLEQAPTLGEIGAGIQISPNGVKVLRALGLDKTVEAAGFRPRASQFREGQSGRVLFTSAMTNYDQRFGAPYLHIHRADLIATLHDAVAQRMPDAVRTGVTVTGYGQDDQRAWAMLDDGSTVEGDIVVGADGIKSAIRTQMIGPDAPRFTGNVAWRAVVPVAKLGRDAPLPVASVWFGAGRHAVTYLLRGGTLANFVGVVEREDWQQESWTEQGTREAAIADFRGWHPTIVKLLEQADAHYRWALFDRDPLDQWTDGRVALLGDACHPMLPFMAQGAVQALEDGYVLARLLAERGDPLAALPAYFSARRDRTAKVQAVARANANLFHGRPSAGKTATYGALRLADKVKPDEADNRLAWIYGHDVTA